MTLQQRQHHRKNPRGTLLAFIAVALQAMLPFFIAVELVRATNPAFADTIPICSSLGATAHHNNGAASDQKGGSCPICAAVAAAQSFTAPPAPAVPLPTVFIRLVPTSTDAPCLGFGALSPYQSRAPPAIV
ncbi:MAG TPA: DUF2946 family protein [Stellaceae bacterium]|nr:DUF2946 family protein [Stellaceae bacterium]